MVAKYYFPVCKISNDEVAWLAWQNRTVHAFYQVNIPNKGHIAGGAFLVERFSSSWRFSIGKSLKTKRTDT